MADEILFQHDFELLSDRRVLSKVDLRWLPIDMVVHWRRCSQTSDWLACYLASNYARADRAADRLSTILNELIENAVKFSTDKYAPVLLEVLLLGDQIRVEMTNTCDERRANDLRERFTEVGTRDVEDLFVEQIERSAATDPRSSRLGLLTLVKDHSARLGARIVRQAGQDRYHVTIQVLLDAEEIANS